MACCSSSPQIMTHQQDCYEHLWNRFQSATVPAGTIPLLVPPGGVCLSKAYAHDVLLLVRLSSLLTVCWAVLTEECRITMSSGTEQRSLRSAESLCPVGQSSAHQGVQDHCAGSASCQLLHSRVCLWRRWSDDGLGRRQCRSPDRPWYLRGCRRRLAVPGWGTTLHHLCQTMDQGLCCSWPVPVLAMPGLCRVNCASETSTACPGQPSPQNCHQFNTSGTSWNNDYSNYCIYCRLCEAVFRNGRTPDRSHWGALSDPWGADVKLWWMHVVATHYWTGTFSQSC